MNTFLKIGSVLPEGPSYLNLSNLSMPSTIQNVGNLRSAFNLTSGQIVDLINNSSEIIGTPKVENFGVSLGKSGFINTNLIEQTNFTYLAVINLNSEGNDLCITTFGHEDLVPSITGKATGIGFAPRRIHGAQATGNFSSMAFSPSPAKDKYAIVALSRAGSELIGCSRVDGVAGIIKANCTSEIQTMTPIGIGCTVNVGALSMGAYHSRYLYAAIHSVALNETDLLKYVNNLAGEINNKEFDGVIL